MGKLDHYDEADQRRIKAIADATAAVNAAHEFLAG